MRYAVLASIICILGLFGLVKFKDWRMTPEERAAETKAFLERQAAKSAEAAERVQARWARNDRIAAAQKDFIEDLLKEPGIESARFIDQEVFVIRLAPALHVGKDHVRVYCEGLALRWATRAELNYARCEEWYGNVCYASGKTFR